MSLCWSVCQSDSVRRFDGRSVCHNLSENLFQINLVVPVGSADAVAEEEDKYGNPGFVHQYTT